MASNLLYLLVAVGLVILNGFFVAAEFGLVKLRQTRVKAIARSQGWRGRILLKVHRELDAYLSACQLGITLASLGLGWIGEPAFADLIGPVLARLGLVNESAVHAISFSAAFCLISYLHIVVGELAPKSMAIRLTEAIGLWTAAPLYVFYWIMFPAIWLLNRSSNLVLRSVGLDLSRRHDSQYSAEELKLILRSSRADANFTAEEWRVLAHALDFRALEVGDLMRPFNEAVPLSAADPVELSLERIVQHRFSRYPYLDADGKVRGVIHLKDIFFALQKDELPETLDALVRSAMTVEPILSAAELFRRFRQGKPHFAIVAWKGEAPLGFLTLDNLLGALVGEIRDEFKQTENDWKKLDDGSLIGKGSLPIFTLERALGLDIDERGAGTVGGLILQRLGDLPVEAQRVPFDRFDAVITKMHGPRIMQVRIYPRDSP